METLNFSDLFLSNCDSKIGRSSHFISLLLGDYGDGDLLARNLSLDCMTLGTA
jgi:hypothetical protein